jgi:hypothetical protein
MAEFTVGGRAYRIDCLRLGEIKAIARINDSPIDGNVEAMLDRFARIVEAATARFGKKAFVASDEAECTVAELTTAARLVLELAGFAQGETPAAAVQTP